MAVINTNISATVTANSLTKNERVLEQTMERLSTGKRINSASDDAAGLAIASKMTSQINGLNQAGRNANDAISMIQTADGAAIEIGNMLQRMRELSVQSANGTNTSTDISNLNIEFAALADEIDRVVDATQWNGMAILAGGEGTGSNGVMSFQIGANDAQTVTVDFADFNLADGTGGSTILSAAIDPVSTTVLGTASVTSTVPGTASVTSTVDGAEAIYTAEIDIADYNAGDTLTVAGVAYTAPGGEANLDALVIALNDSTASSATPYTFSATGTTLTMTADARGAIASDPTAVGSIAITNTETTEGAVDAFAEYTFAIDITDYDTADTITIAGNAYAVTGSSSITTIADAMNLSNASTATPYTWSGAGTTLTATANAAGTVAADPVMSGAVAVATTGSAGTDGTPDTFANWSSALNITAYDEGDIITTNGTDYTVTATSTQDDLITALNASATTATAAYTYSTSASKDDIVMVADAPGSSTADGTTAVAKAYTATVVTEGSTAAPALYTSTIDAKDYAEGDVITAAGASYTVTGNETDNTELVQALNDSALASATGYTFASSGANNLTMTQDTAATVASDPTVAVTTLNTVAEGTPGVDDVTSTVAGTADVTTTVAGTADVTTTVAGTAAVTASSTGVFGVALGGALSSSGTINTETADIINTLDTAIAGVASQRATFGAAMNRLEYTVDNLMSVSQNTSASRSRIEDADYAAETTELARAQIIAQAATAMLSQANQQAQSVLALLK
jgi:flagellin